MTVAALALAAALTASEPAPKAEIRNVRISASCLKVSREKSESEAWLTGTFRVDMSFSKPTVRKPVVRFACLFDIGGELVADCLLLDRPGGVRGIQRSEVTKAFKNAGVDIPFKERETACVDPAKFTPLLSEVTKDAYQPATYGLPGIKRGFFSLGRSVTLPQLLVYRIEVWQNGVLVASYDSSRTGLGRYAIPDDWHVWNRYLQKFNYRRIR